MPSTLLSALHELNKEIVYVWDTSEIAEINPRSGETKLKYMKPHDFKNADYSNRFIEIKGKRIFLAAEWMKWDLRRVVNRTVYEPGLPRITADNDLNTWFESPNKPIKGDCVLFFKYLDHMFTTDPTYKNWFIAWLAYPLQYPGTKLHTASVFWSTMTATGKSTLAYIMREIYGQHNCSLLQESDFEDDYNGWAVNKVFIEVDEMPEGTKARRRADYLKSLTTRSRLPVKLKYQNRYEIRDTINYYYTSNHLTSLYLSPEDRRFFVHNVGSIKLPEEFFRKQLGPWLKGGGFSHVHHWLKYEVDLSLPVIGGDPYSSVPAPFSPGAAAPHTQSRQAVIEAGYDEVEAWIRELLDNPTEVLPTDDNRTLFTAKELHKILRDSCPDIKVGPKALARKLNEQGTQIQSGEQIRINGTLKLRLHTIETDALTMDLPQLRLRWSQERGQD